MTHYIQMPRNDWSGPSASFAPVESRDNSSVSDLAVTVSAVLEPVDVKTDEPNAVVKAPIVYSPNRTIDEYVDSIEDPDKSKPLTGLVNTTHDSCTCKLSGKFSFSFTFLEMRLEYKGYPASREQIEQATATGQNLKTIVLTKMADQVAQLFSWIKPDPYQKWMLGITPTLRKLNHVFSAYMDIRSMPQETAIHFADAIALSKILCFHLPCSNKRLLIDVCISPNREHFYLFGYILSQESIYKLSYSMIDTNPFLQHIPSVPLSPLYVIVNMKMLLDLVDPTKTAGHFAVKCHTCQNLLNEAHVQFKQNVATFLYKLALLNVSIILLTDLDIEIARLIVSKANELGWGDSLNFTIGLENVRSTCGLIPNHFPLTYAQILPFASKFAKLDPKPFWGVDLLSHKSKWDYESTDKRNLHSILFYDDAADISRYYENIIHDVKTCLENRIMALSTPAASVKPKLSIVSLLSEYKSSHMSNSSLSK